MIDCLDKDLAIDEQPAPSTPAAAAAFKAITRAWAVRIGVRPAALHVRPMRRKWASCSPKGRLTFDTGLLTQPVAFQTEVIVHELVHLLVPNHGRLFRSMLRAFLAEAGPDGAPAAGGV